MLLTPARPQSLGLQIALIAYAPPSSMPRLWTRQNARAFNQPLSFDTSSVTSMQYMFEVRAPSAHATHSPVGPMLHVT